MLPQLTVYAKILFLLMLVIAGVRCNTNQVYLYSKCASRFVGLTPDGKVLANDNSGSGRQTVTISNHVPQGLLTGPLKLTLFIEEAQMYVCFTKRWRLVTSKKLQEYCYFYETLENGWFQYRSAVDETKHIGFTKNGKPVRYVNRPRTVRDSQCFNLQKVDPRDIDDHQTMAIESPKRHHSTSTSLHHQQHQQQQIHQILSSAATGHQQQQQEQQHHYVNRHHNMHHVHQQQSKQIATSSTQSQASERKIAESSLLSQQSTSSSAAAAAAGTAAVATSSSKSDKNKIFQKKHALRKQNMTNTRRGLFAKNMDGSRSKYAPERYLDYSNDDYSKINEYSNVTKKPLVNKKVTSINNNNNNNNSSIGPKFRHLNGKNHRKKITFDKENI